MPRVSKAQSDQNRQTIEHVAGKLFRERGIDAVSIADLMAAAGLTHGGFYGHFESKDVLAALTCEKIFTASGHSLERRAREADSKPAALRAYIEAYLKAATHPGSGCAIPALAMDVARQPEDKPVRPAFLRGLKSILGKFARLSPHAGPVCAGPGADLPDDHPATARQGRRGAPASILREMATEIATEMSGDSGPEGDQTLDFDLQAPANRQAMQQIAMLVGSVILARATQGDPLADGFLDLARESVPQLGTPAPPDWDC